MLDLRRAIRPALKPNNSVNYLAYNGALTQLAFLQIVHRNSASDR